MSEESRGIPGEFTAGALVAGYRLEERIGRGGMAVVFRAHDPRLDRRVALKILSPDLARDDAFRQRFIRESRAAAAVDDPHIIPVYEAGEAGGVLFIAMRYVRGGDVRSLLDREGPLPPARATEIIAQAASALDAAHARGLVHRDVKPANMLLDESADSERPDHVYLSDFGLTKTLLSVAGLTMTGQFLGTLDYVAPEQIEGRPVDGRTDLYALACAAFELLTGAPPFRRDESVAVLYAQVSEAPPLLSSRRSGLPAAADQVMARALAKAPGDRYGTCREFATALRRALGVAASDSGPQPRVPDRPPTQVAGPPQAGRPPTQVATPAGEGQAAATPAGEGQAAAAVSGPAAAPPAGYAPAGPPAGAAGFASAGPATEAAGVTPPRGYAGPLGGAAAAGGNGDTDPGSFRPRRPWWRSPVRLGAAGVVLLAGVGGYLLSGHGGGSGPSGHGGGTVTGSTTLTAPGCTSATPRLHALSGVASQRTPVGGVPVAVVNSHDGNYAFVTLNNKIGVLANGSGLAPALQHTLGVPGADNGVTLAGGGRDLVAAGRSGAAIIDANAAERGSVVPVATLASPQGGGAIGVQVSADGRYLFVTLGKSTDLAVFNLSRALSDPSYRTHPGLIRLGAQPFGLALSKDGKWLYATSMRRTPGTTPGEGTLSVISVARAETSPATAVRATVNAGCGPSRVTTDRGTVWVTARFSNALLGFSAARLLTSPRHALVADVPVGQKPIGVTPLPGGGRLVVADSGQGTQRAGNLAVVSVPAALAGKPAVLGVIPADGQPHQMTLSQHQSVILVANQLTSDLQAVKIADLPSH